MSLNELEQQGKLQSLYNKHYAQSVQKMDPQARRVFELFNPNLGHAWQAFQPRYL
ncbi:hypothetical protein [Vibrio vulnificus]|nr:hypothetical protein [Vibrio vulnificus]MCU8161692.1 hypothetical protein [Vibrio vulnificus]